MSVYNEYIQQAKILARTDEALSLQEKIVAHYISRIRKSEPRPFLAIGAPSGTGKTQMSFTMAEYENLHVRHICLSSKPKGDSMQWIYKHPSIDQLSDLVQEALIGDMKDFPDETTHSATNFLSSNYEFRIVALLSKVFNIPTLDGQMICIIRELREAVQQLTDGPIFPVLFVDEAFQFLTNRGKSNNEKKHAHFLRAVLRAVGIASVFMGTTANTVQFVQNHLHMSSGSGNVRPWATFIANLPPTMLSKSEIPAINCPRVRNFCDRLMDITTVNPRYIQKFNKYAGLFPNKPLELVLDKIRMKLYSQKEILRRTSGLRAQVLYLLNCITTSEITSTFVNTHFAHFAKDEVVGVLNNKAVLKGEVTIWNPKPNYPTSRQDPLLALLLGGSCCSLYPPFLLNIEPSHSIRLTSAAAYVLGDCNQAIA